MDDLRIFSKEHGWNIPKKVLDLVSDIAFGICNSQKLSDSEKGTYDMSKVKKYTPKTELCNTINNLLIESKYRDAYKWQNDNTFQSIEGKIQVIKYDITTNDKCLIKIDDEETLVLKIYLKDLWDNRIRGR